MSTYAGKDGCTNTILDFIAGGVPLNPSGEADGNYNAVIGNVHATQDLAALTELRIYVLMDKLKQHEPSTAVGRYQFIYATLVSLSKARGLAPSTLFTHELQDQLAVDLLRGRGYASWWRGAMHNAEFAYGMSCEWASLPDPENGGKSHYDHVGPNHASTPLSNVYTMLNAARLLIPKHEPLFVTTARGALLAAVR